MAIGTTCLRTEELFQVLKQPFAVKSSQFKDLKEEKCSVGASICVPVCRQHGELEQEALPNHIGEEGVLTLHLNFKMCHGTGSFTAPPRPCASPPSGSPLRPCRIPVIVEQVSTRKTAPRDSLRTSLEHEQSFLHFGGKTTPCTVPFKQKFLLF